MCLFYKKYKKSILNNINNAFYKQRLKVHPKCKLNLLQGFIHIIIYYIYICSHSAIIINILGSHPGFKCKQVDIKLKIISSFLKIKRGIIRC